MSNRQKRDEKTEQSYDVGFGKPPKSGQFKPGHSGNTRGRPKKVKPEAGSLNESIRDALTRQRTITSQGVKRNMTAVEIIGEQFVTELVNNPSKGLKSHMPFITALLAVEPKAECDYAADAAEIRAQIEAIAERRQVARDYEADREAEEILEAAAKVMAANQR